MDAEAAKALGSGIANFGWAMAASVATVVVGNSIVRLVRPTNHANSDHSKSSNNGELLKPTAKGTVVERIAAIEATNSSLAAWFEKHEKQDHENFTSLRNELKAGFDAINERLDRMVIAVRQNQ